MLIIPAIDLQDGVVVRFLQGKFDKRVYSKDPVKTARHWEKAGAQMLHIVDLDGAITGKAKNLGIVRKIAAAVNVPVEVGGGIRRAETIKKLINDGVNRVVLGTRAAQDREFLKKAYKNFRDKIIVSIDAQGQNVLIRGWRKSLNKSSVTDFTLALKDIGFRELIYTDTLKDGALSGPNIKSVKALMEDTAMKIIASGGISSLKDIQRMKLLEKEGLLGIIIGKALYEGRFTLSEALKFA